MISAIKAAVQAVNGRFQPAVPVSLFFRSDGYSVGEVTIDLILSEDHSLSAAVTQHPVQDGSVVSDHITVLPRSGTMRALVSNHSLSAAEAQSDEDETWKELYERGASATLRNRAQEAWEALKKVVEAKELITIVTALEVYDNVALTGIRTTRDGETGDSLEIEIDFEQVNRVSLKETRVTLQVQPKDMKSTINQKSAVEIATGQQVGIEATEEEEAELTLPEVAI